jgi:uncharacterized phage-associated protein
MGKSAKYYNSNSKAKAAKKKYDTEFNKKPDQVKKRTELNKINRTLGTYGNGDKMDMSHTKEGIKPKPQSENRGSSKDMPGDKRSRGKKSASKKKKL